MNLKAVVKFLSVMGIGYAFFDGIALSSRMLQTPHIGNGPLPIFTAPVIGVDLAEVGFLWAMMLISFLGLIWAAPKSEETL